MTVTGGEAAGDEVVWVAVQREWTDDPAGLVKIGRYDVATASWTFARYQLEAPVLPAGGFMGLSEITALPDGTWRSSSATTRWARTRRSRGSTRSIRRASRSPRSVSPSRCSRGPSPPPDARRRQHPHPGQARGLRRDPRKRRMFIVTDNDGVDENDGATAFLQIGRLGRS